MSVIISECGSYRYTLKRDWPKPCLFIMLNPSTADAAKDDPTLKACMRFAKREGCTSLTIVNLFALRSPNPDILLKRANPSGSQNRAYQATEIEKARGGLVIVAWGSHKSTGIKKDNISALLKIIRGEGLTPYCLGVNKDGNPKHPLYLKNNQELIEYVGFNLNN